MALYSKRKRNSCRVTSPFLDGEKQQQSELSILRVIEAREELPLYCKRKRASSRVKNIVEDPNHKLHSLLPPVNVEYQYNLRNKRFFRLPKCKTNRFNNTFMIASASQY